MKMRIEMGAKDSGRFRRPIAYFAKAREGFKAFLQSSNLASGITVLLPAYIGWSQREGSGVFDPIMETGLPYAFYRMDDKLRIDLEHLEQLFKTTRVGILLIIHYFGYVDPGYPEAVRLARENNVLVLEDEAHALYSDLVGGICGRLGDAVIFSLHKMLPFGIGGMLMYNSDIGGSVTGISQNPHISPWDYDLHEIAQCRRRNVLYLTSLLTNLEDEISLLRPELPEGVFPQTFPVLIRRASRDRLYQVMNDDGFGVVSLYHTLISQISKEQFPDSDWLSHKIMNLPVHQDVTRDTLSSMVDALDRNIRK